MPGFIRGNRLRLLYNGHDYFTALLAEIASACQEIYLETYLYELDEVGLRVAEALIAAAQRGVRVRLHIDGFGARNFPKFWQ